MVITGRRHFIILPFAFTHVTLKSYIKRKEFLLMVLLRSD
ncbi:hypothetical protein SS17_1196 [Escherichia coli O157:H7 str. SS17]|uniref:Uncharacterized protein n=1 Tax=Escherichia coli O157:H7 TaxID=83334 RepID=Q8X461_ECO57|nr:hypothetical protein Z1541 [Escherichia coli O157:H7 str. EDL933]ADD55868.1 hypothetical protein G2583_1272 [Escherichia coli O55:H7 str. CB9615]AIF92780.1 hypothetical protein SS17_1196 [Escherichia coli O157:H7 str. SS17]